MLLYKDRVGLRTVSIYIRKGSFTPLLKRLSQSIMTSRIGLKLIEMGLVWGAPLSPPLELIGKGILGVVLGCREGTIGYDRLFLKDRFCLL